jgi:hypothetical protein
MIKWSISKLHFGKFIQSTIILNLDICYRCKGAYPYLKTRILNLIEKKNQFQNKRINY